MIVFEECDFCTRPVAGRKVDITYVRDDGDENVLCLPCMRIQLEDDYRKDEKKGK
jgi:hypothetical protein